MNYVLVGVNHKTAPVEIREKLSLNAEKSRDVQLQLVQKPEIKEVAVISTCNRVEFYTTTDSPESAELCLHKLFSESLNQGDARQDVSPYLYVKRDTDAVSHLFEVAASVDSQVTGENQIIGQVKDAYQQALDLSVSGFYLNKLFDRALFVAKRVKTETDIARGNVSIGSVGVVLAKKIFGDLKSRSVVLVGAGEMGELVLQYLREESVERITIVNRTLEKAQELAQKGFGEACALDQLPELLKTADVLITSVSGEIAAFSPLAMQALMRERGGDALFVIDLGLPRNISASVGDLDNLYLYNIDDLKDVSAENRENRQASLVEAKNIIDQEVKLFYEKVLDFNALPAIAQLGKKFETVRVAELNKTLAKLGHLAEEDRQAVDKLTQVLMNRVLHEPILTLKNRHETSHPGIVDVFKKIFRLDDEG